MIQVRTSLDTDGRYLDDAAAVWAEGTAVRDGTEVAPLQPARVPIAAVLSSSPRTTLVVALDADDRVAGFAAVAPGSERTADVRYLGVRPAASGCGLRGLRRSGRGPRRRGPCGSPPSA